jgi:hypothetical protein
MVKLQVGLNAGIVCVFFVSTTATLLSNFDVSHDSCASVSHLVWTCLSGTGCTWGAHSRFSVLQLQL